MTNRFFPRACRYLVCTLLALFVPTIALADSAANTRTGANSVNRATTSNSTTTSVTLNNDSSVTNGITLTADTGNNSASGNTGNAGISSGSVDLATDVKTTANLQAPQPGTTSTTTTTQLSATNDTTGANSTNTASATATVTQNQVVANRSSVVNSAVLSANTGNNQANNNTGSAFVRSGNITGRVSFNTVANTRTNQPPAVTPTPGGGGGGGTVTPPAITTTTTTTTLATVPAPTPTVSATPTAAPVKVAQVSQPKTMAAGGGFFPTGGDWLPLLTTLLMLSFGVAYAKELEGFLSRPFPWQVAVV